MSLARQVAFRLLRDLETGRRERLADGLDPALDPRERRLARELCFGVERNVRLLDHVLGGYLDKGLPADPSGRTALRLGAQQLLFTPGVAPHAAVFETVAVAAARHKPLANAVLRRLSAAIRPSPGGIDGSDGGPGLSLPGDRWLEPVRPLPDRTTDLPGFLAVRYSLPDFLAARWVERFGAEAAERSAAACTRVPRVHLRPVRGDRDTLARALADEGVETEPADHPRVLCWGRRHDGASPFGTRAFREGRFVAQDPTALRAAEAVGAEPGETVLDLCAAPGTKAAWLAECVGEEGLVVAYDVDPERRERIVETAARLGLPALAVVESTAGLQPMDRALVDAPCSNTGVLARRVEARRRLRPEAIARLAELQRDLLLQAVDAVRVGGTVVYSTCSVEAEENEGVVEAALAARPGLEPVRQELTLPAVPEHDGGFFAVLRVRERATTGA